MSTRTHQARTPQALPRVLGLEPRWRDLPALAVVNTRAFGLYSRDAVRVSTTGHAVAERMWRWRVWVALSSWPALLSLVGDRAAGWAAAVDKSSVMRVRPKPVPTGQRLQYLLGAFVAVALILVVLAVIMLSTTLVLGWDWVAVLLLALVAACLGVVWRDQSGRGMGRELPTSLPVDLFSGHVYVGTGFCAYPHGSKHGQHLFDAVLEQTEQQPVHGTLVIRARNKDLAKVYARPEYGFRLLDPHDTSAQPVMYRRLG